MGNGKKPMGRKPARTTVLTRARTPQTTHPMGLLLRSLYKMLPVIQSKPAHDNYMALVARLMRTCLQIAPIAAGAGA